MEAEKPFLLRPYASTDVNFIKNSWAHSYYQGASFKGGLEFNVIHRPYRDGFFDRPTATVIVACFKEDPDVILGWMAIEKTKSRFYLHYIYVKHSFQREGIAKELLNLLPKDQEITITHLTEKADRIINCHKDLFAKYFYESITALEQLGRKNVKHRRKSGPVHPVPHSTPDREQTT